jgi:hypothetical protein
LLEGRVVRRAGACGAETMTSLTPARLSPLAALAALALLALAAPAGAVYAYGTIVDKNDYDFQQAPSVRGTVPAAGKFVLPCWADDDGDGRPTGAETIYLVIRTGLAATCDSVHAKDIRLTAHGSLAPGSVAKAGEADDDARLSQLGSPAAPAHAVRAFNDADLAATVRKTDTVYLDLNGLGAPRVDVGDVRLSPFGAMKAGTRVAAGDPDLNNALVEFNGGAAKTLYTANMLYEFGKSFYLNADLDAAAGGAVEEGDVRLTSAVPNPFADVAAGFGNPGRVVDGLRLSADAVRPGETFQAHVLVKNPAAKVGSALVETRLDGVLVDARGTPTLARDEAATLVVTLVAPAEPGQHKVQAGETTAFFEVEAAQPPAPAPAAELPASQPTTVRHQSVPAADALLPLALLGAALVALRRAGQA